MTRKGFTLIELLVVVLIMGILASVAMPQYFKSVEKSRAAEAISALEALVSAQERAYMKTGSYITGNITGLKKFDIGISNLSYFTVLSIRGDSGGKFDGAYYAGMERTEEAGAGLGKYKIYLYYPPVPGTGARHWGCTPRDAGCKSFLPHED